MGLHGCTSDRSSVLSGTGRRYLIARWRRRSVRAGDHEAARRHHGAVGADHGAVVQLHRTVGDVARRWGSGTSRRPRCGAVAEVDRAVGEQHRAVTEGPHRRAGDARVRFRHAHHWNGSNDEARRTSMAADADSQLELDRSGRHPRCRPRSGRADSRCATSRMTLISTEHRPGRRPARGHRRAPPPSGRRCRHRSRWTRRSAMPVSHRVRSCRCPFGRLAATVLLRSMNSLRSPGAVVKTHTGEAQRGRRRPRPSPRPAPARPANGPDRRTTPTRSPAPSHHGRQIRTPSCRGSSACRRGARPAAPTTVAAPIVSSPSGDRGGAWSLAVVVPSSASHDRPGRATICAGLHLDLRRCGAQLRRGPAAPQCSGGAEQAERQDPSGVGRVGGSPLEHQLSSNQRDDGAAMRRMADGGGTWESRPAMRDQRCRAASRHR